MLRENQSKVQRHSMVHFKWRDSKIVSWALTSITLFSEYKCNVSSLYQAPAMTPSLKLAAKTRFSCLSFLCTD